MHGVLKYAEIQKLKDKLEKEEKEREKGDFDELKKIERNKE